MTLVLPFKTASLSDPKGWEWRESPLPALADPEQVLVSPELRHGWTACVQSPSAVHVELLAAGQIEDPFLGLNEEKVQWVGERDWLYRTTVRHDDSAVSGSRSDLVFQGLDTFVTVFLNGKRILQADNMFRSWRINVTEMLVPGDNALIFVFQSAFIHGRIEEERRLGQGQHLGCWNGDPSRLFVRKAQYHYSWDWGPLLMTAGPWKPVSLETYSVRLVDLHTRPLVESDLSATLLIEASVSSQSPHLRLHVSLVDPSGKIVRQVPLSCGDSPSTSTSWKLESGEVDLWWSTGLGNQALYTVQADLVTSNGVVVDTKSKKIGFRRLRVVQEPLDDVAGTSFYFEVNNTPLFCGGANWIPIDSFLTNATKDRYRAWLELLVEGNQNMIRSWGGGIYEHDDFFDLCDELGILVWQDFAFGCGAYPAHPEFIASVKAEAEDNVRRIRHHPCIAIYAGNNEDYQVAEALGLEYDPDDQNGDWEKTNFPARVIYERVLPEVVHRLSPDIFYHPGSPWGGKTTRDPTVGDIHQWNVWHGTQEQYQTWDQLGGRFVSEFGMQGLPNVQTIDYFLDGATAERYPQSETIGYHDKAAGYERRLELYLVENIRHGFGLDDYIFATQLIQAEALSTAYRLWRRNFKGPGKAYTAGALVWQLNDVYPCTSWSIIDYFLRPKPAYYSIKQSLAPVAVGMKRSTSRVYPDRHSAATFIEKSFVEIWAFNSFLTPKEVNVVVEAFELLSGVRIYHKTTGATLLPNRSTELEKLEVPMVTERPEAAIVVTTKLVDVLTFDVLSRYSAYPEPYKFLTFPRPEQIQLSVDIGLTSSAIYLNTSHPIKCLVLACNEDVIFSDNALDLIPHDSREIKVRGLTTKSKISWRYLGDALVP